MDDNRITYTRDGMPMIGFGPTLNDIATALRADFDKQARANGYIKLKPGQIVIDTNVWLPYLEKAINAAKILQKHGSFTVKHYHGDWPSLEMLEGLKRVIDGQPKENLNE